MERSSSSEERIQACLREFRRRKIEKQKEKAKVSYLTASLNFEVIHVGAGETMRAVEEMLATKDKAMMDRVALRGFSESTENRNIPIDNTSGVNKLGSLHISQSRPHLPWTKRIEGFPNKNENTPTDDTSELYKVGSLQISEEPPYEEIQRSRVPPSDDSVYYWI
ncbi:hypothetical protein ACHQM5_028629 [Ranunculus cassubicifolius]